MWNTFKHEISIWNPQKIKGCRSFFALYPSKNPKNQNFETKNLLDTSAFQTSAPKITIIWCIVPEIQSETDNFFLSFWAIFYPFTCPLMIQNIKILIKMKKHKSLTDRNFWHFGPFFPFQPLDKLENQNFNIIIWCMVPEIWSIQFLPFWTIFWTIKKPGYIIILHMCTINNNHMMYDSWDNEGNWHNFFATLDCCFLHFTHPPPPLTTRKMKILKKI